MNVSATFIQRPVMTTLVMSGILVFGIMAYRFLPVSDLPNVDFPTLQVIAGLPGANPDTMASSVALPLEKEFSTIAGLDSMTSVSYLGQSQVTLQFALDRNIDAAAQDVQAAISRAGAKLPPNMPTPPSYKKVNPADQPVLFVALVSETLPLYTLDEYAETMMAQRISTVSGVAQVQVFGAQKYAVRAQVDPDLLAAKNIGLDEVATAIQKANVNLPTGVFDGRHRSFTVDVHGQLTDADAYRPIIVAYRNGNPVKLEELGRVIDSVENERVAAWFNNARGMVLAIQRQPGTNTIEVVDAVKRLLPTFQAQLPAAATLNILYDRSESIRNSVDDVKFTLMLTLALVVMVIFVFLRSITATLIPSIAIPMSLVGTFAFMYVMNYTVDNFSLMALTLSVGFVVDDAIVVLENIVRHMERGERPFEAALRGSREIGFTVISMTISLVSVFIPVIFMGGLIGRLLSEFALTIGMAILVSGFVSLTLTPMLCSRFLRPGKEAHHGRFYAFTERFFDGVLKLYERSLAWVLRRHLLTVAVSAAVLAATVYLYTSIPKGFLPNEDQSRIFAPTEAVEGISYESMIQHQRAVAEIIKADPRVESFMSSIGARGGAATAGNTGTMFIKLVPRSKRDKGVEEIIQELRQKVAQVPGIKVYLQNLPTLRVGGTLTKSQYQYTMQGPDTDQMYAAVPRLVEKMRTLPGFQDVTSDLQLSNPQVHVEIDRDKAATLGVTAEQIEVALGSAYGTRQVSTIYAPNNQYQVILEVLPAKRSSPDTLSMLHVRAASGMLIPLETVARIHNNLGPLSVNHLGQLPAVTVSFNLAPGYALGPAVEQVQSAAAALLPQSITGSFQGAAQAFQSSQQGMETLLILAILVIYMVLGILYESFVHPITILTALPFAGFGALLTLQVFHMDLNLYAFVGVIMLVGLVKKNGIMMVDFALEAQRERNLSPRDAILEACLVRFRPIMMTTMAALMGTLPIALGLGAGAETRRPLGLAVVGGLVFSQSLTLFVTPVFYMYMEWLNSWLKGLRRRHPRSSNLVTGATGGVLEPLAQRDP